MLYEFWSGLHESPKKKTFEQNIQSRMMTKSHRLISCLSTLYSRAALGEPAFPLVSWVYNAPFCREKGSCFWHLILDGYSIQEPVLKRKDIFDFFFPLLFPCLFWFKNQHSESWSWNCLSFLRNRSTCGIHGAATCVTRQRWLWHPYVCRGNAPGPEHCFLLNLQDAEIKIKWSSGFK